MKLLVLHSLLLLALAARAQSPDTSNAKRYVKVPARLPGSKKYRQS